MQYMTLYRHRRTVVNSQSTRISVNQTQTHTQQRAATVTVSEHRAQRARGVRVRGATEVVRAPTEVNTEALVGVSRLWELGGSTDAAVP